MWRSPEESGTSGLPSRVVVLSPHLDDAVLSLGAAIARATRAGAHVKCLTVFAYGEADRRPAAAWDRACGFESAAEARKVRRKEDARACGLVGAVPEWLDFFDVEYGDRVEDDDLWARIAPAIEGADALLVPGFPLAVPDHLRLARLALSRRPARVRLGLFAEQPYASWGVMSRGGRAGSAGLSAADGVRNAARIALATPAGRRLVRPETAAELLHLVEEPVWQPLRSSLRDWTAKRRAIQAHRSQVKGFGPLVLTRIALHERAWGGEAVAWLAPR